MHSQTAANLEEMLRGDGIHVINTENFIIEGGLNENQLNTLKVRIMKY